MCPHLFLPDVYKQHLQKRKLYFCLAGLPTHAILSCSDRLCIVRRFLAIREAGGSLLSLQWATCTSSTHPNSNLSPQPALAQRSLSITSFPCHCMLACQTGVYINYIHNSYRQRCSECALLERCVCAHAVFAIVRCWSHSRKTFEKTESRGEWALGRGGWNWCVKGVIENHSSGRKTVHFSPCWN